MIHPQFMWWVSRATGMVGGLLLVGSLVWGVLLATRVLKPVDRPAWLLGLHRWMSALACIMIAIHMAALVADNYVYFGWRELFVPWGSEWKNTAVALGVIAMWLLVLVQGTSLLMRWMPKKVWHAIHVTSYAAVWLGFVHGALAGTDVTNPVYQYIVMLLILAAMGFALVRVLIGTNRARARENAAARSGGAGPQSADGNSANGNAAEPSAESAVPRATRNPRIPEAARAAARAAASTVPEAAPADAAPARTAPADNMVSSLPPPALTVPPVSSSETDDERQARLEALAATRANRQGAPRQTSD
ncbi:MAG: ferric reductase-like transmembrane domain-containing protein [Ilumatobacteraceae bacterium]